MSIFDKPAERFFTTGEEKEIVAVIKQAESLTSGEIRVHLENHCTANEVMERAWELFHELEMGETALRNGVLIYLAVRDHSFAVIADKGIHEKVEPNFWESEVGTMSAHFKKGEFKLGIIKAIQDIGQKLANYFPPSTENPNELSDDISFGELTDEV
ncbi:MAG: TPM domain-containing protein [Bacteroidota bacterium]